MSDDDLIRRGDALYAIAGWEIPSTAIAALPAVTVGVQERVQHKRRGSTYRVLGRGKMQTDTPLADYAEVVVYQGEADGLVWVRPVTEFEDGRFAALKPVAAPDPADDPECTDCEGTGITIQTERRCACQPAPDPAAIREAALRAASEVCAGIRQRIANGPMPEGARFDYEQAILALIAKGAADDRA